MTSAIPFGRRRIGADAPVVVIAEIGINHEGDEAACGRLIESAANAGADAIKLQTVDADRSYAPDTPSHALFARAALSREATARMFAFARGLGIEAFTTAGDPETLAWVDRLDPAAHKISSGLLTHLPLLGAAAKTGRSVLVSTGMAELSDIDEAVGALAGAPLALFQCTSLYPAPPAAINLAAMSALADRYRVPVGLSDHSLGVEGPAFAAAAGARMIEKHFTLDPSRPSFDHQLSLGPAEFARAVELVRLAEAMRGDGAKRLMPGEAETRARARRSIVAIRPIVRGEKIDPSAVAILRTLPGRAGLPPRSLSEVTSSFAARDLSPFEPVTADALAARP